MLKGLLRKLINIYVNCFPDLKSRPHLLLVTGNNDPSSSPVKILPRAQLSKDFIPTDYQNQIYSVDNPNDKNCWIHLLSNPCRVQVFTRSMVLFRSNYSKLFLRHCLRLPTVEESKVSCGELLGRGLAKCIASQTHLMPIALHMNPVFWTEDHALHLNPLPDLLIATEPEAIADLNSVDPVGKCKFINPGSFGNLRILNESDELSNNNENLSPSFKVEYNFQVWYPSTHTIEESRLPDE